MMASSVVLLSLLLLTCSTFMSSKSHSINSTSDGFSISIIHRDSPESPLYNPSATPYETHIAKLRRSFSRLEHFSMRASESAIPHSQTQSNKPPEKTRIFFNPQSLEYIASYFIGYPNGQLVRAFVDTGSEITWTNVNTPNGYDPSKSTTYSKLRCSFAQCQGLGNRKTCKDGSQPCTYTQEYGGGRIITSGVLSKDIFSFDYPGNRSSPEQQGFYLYFGCNDQVIGSTGEFYGILGLDRGPLSFISQLRIKRFSHCLVAPDKRSPSTMHFGSSAMINPKGFTPFVQGAFIKRSFYYVTLEGISVGSTKVPIPQGTFDVTPDGDGGFVVDSGIPYTYLTAKAYDPFLDLMRSVLPKHLVVYRVNDLDCFNGTQKDLDGIPLVTFHFARGVDVKLAKERTFVNIMGEAWCLAIAKSFVGKLSLFGSFQMANLNVVYDLEKNGVSFTQADCSASTIGN